MNLFINQVTRGGTRGKETPPMRWNTTIADAPLTVCCETLETIAWTQIQHWLQDPLETEVTAFLERDRYARRSDAQADNRNG